MSFKDGEEYAETNGMKFYECSAKTGINVDNIFIDTATEISEAIDKGEYDLLSDTSGIKMGIGARELKNQHKKLVLNHNQSNKSNKDSAKAKKCC